MSTPLWVTDKIWEPFTLAIHERKLNAAAILFWPLYFITVPIAFIGGIVEFVYYSIVGIATGDIELLTEITTTLYTDGVVGTMINAAKGFVQIPSVWWSETYLQVLQVSWNLNVYTGFFTYFVGVTLNWVQIVFYEEVGWVIFDNFYTALQF